MSHKEKIAAAEKGCQKAQAAWTDASAALAGRVSVNGYGIYHDASELRRKLLSAQSSIQEAIRALDEVEWPTNADYDQL
jgi:hypothetical protein